MILTRNPALEFLNEVTVAPLTTTIRDIPSEVELSRADGVPEKCAVNFDHMQTVPKAKLGKLIAQLPGDKWGEVEKAIGFALGFGT
jgi:mRNA interferase MazF